jgi:hypothetical protein
MVIGGARERKQFPAYHVMPEELFRGAAGLRNDSDAVEVRLPTVFGRLPSDRGSR